MLNISEAARQCIQDCFECARACENCATACLGEDMVGMMVECIRADRDCADLCSLCARFLMRKSDLATELCRLCAMACDLCGEECASHEQDHCQLCAQACRQCAISCRKVAEAEA